MVLQLVRILHESLNYYINFMYEEGIIWLGQLHQQSINKYRQ